MKHKIGLIVNPVAGMGGSVGLKGTDIPNKVVEKVGGETSAEDTKRISKKLLQGAKEASSISGSSVEWKKEIARYTVEEMDKRVLYLLGPGTTPKAIADELGVPKTLLGIDAIFEEKSVGKDLNEKGILALFDKYNKKK